MCGEHTCAQVTVSHSSYLVRDLAVHLGVRAGDGDKKGQQARLGGAGRGGAPN